MSSVPDPDEDPWLGRRLADKYEILEALDSGGIALVYRAEHTALSRQVAVKVLRESSAERADFRARFEREARALAALAHPNIVSIIDFGWAEGSPYLVMELLEGRSLADLRDDEGQLPPERAFAIIRQVLRALSYVHQQGILHRDLKPGNVFLQALPDTTDHVKLLDFGFVKLTDETSSEQLTREGTVFGTPAYISPEQMLGQPATARSDQYAAGVLFFELLAGRRPFEGSHRQMLVGKSREDAPPLGRVAPELIIAEELEAILARALSRDPAQRFEGVDTLLAAVDALDPAEAVRVKDPLGEEPAPPSEGSSAEPEEPQSQSTPKRRARPAFPLPIAIGAASILALAVIGCVVTGLTLLTSEPEDPESSNARKVHEFDDLPEPEPSTGTQNPWSVGALIPTEVEAVRTLLAQDRDVPRAELTALRRYAQDHDRDPRAQLVLGHVFARRGMRALAITAYARAAELDPSMRGDPRMLDNLILMSTDARVGSGPERLLRDLYGTEAVERIDALAAHPSVDRRRAQRLSALSARLARE